MKRTLQTDTSDDNNKKSKSNKEQKEEQENPPTYSLYSMQFQDDRPSTYLVPNDIISEEQREWSKNSNNLSLRYIDDVTENKIQTGYWMLMSLLEEGYSLDDIVSDIHVKKFEEDVIYKLKDNYGKWSKYKQDDAIENQHITFVYFFNFIV